MVETYKRRDGEGLGANKVGEGREYPRANKNSPQK
jgi:hypothetical protein